VHERLPGDRGPRWWHIGAVAMLVALPAALLTGCTPAPDATVQAATFTVAAGGSNSGRVDCPAGKQALGGGVLVDGAAGDVYLLDDAPLDDLGGLHTGRPARAWFASATNVGSSQHTVRLYALCSSLAATVQATTISVDAYTIKDAYAACPSGQRALGGGVADLGSPQTMFIKASGPLDSSTYTVETDDGSVPTQWYGAASNPTLGPQSMTVAAVCSASSTATIAASVFIATSDGAPRSATATCPSGRRALGGGVAQSGAPNDLFVLNSGPLDESGTPSGTVTGDVARSWRATLSTVGYPGTYAKVFAVCA